MNAHSHSPGRRTRQQGAALVLALVMLIVMTMIAVVAMRTTTVDLKAATNNLVQKIAFQDSESSRVLLTEVLRDHTNCRCWPLAVGGTGGPEEPLIPGGLNVVDATKQLWAESLADYPAAGASPVDGAIDFTYVVDVNADNDASNDEDYNVDIFSWRMALVPAAGSETSQAAGYAGVGGGAAGGGANLFYDLRARAEGAANARAMTGAIIRVPIR